MCDLEIGLDAHDVVRARPDRAGRPSPSAFPRAPPRSSDQIAGGEPAPRDLGAGDGGAAIDRVIGFGLQHHVQRHRQPRRGRSSPTCATSVGSGDRSAGSRRNGVGLDKGAVHPVDDARQHEARVQRNKATRDRTVESQRHLRRRWIRSAARPCGWRCIDRTRRRAPCGPEPSTAARTTRLSASGVSADRAGSMTRPRPNRPRSSSRKASGIGDRRAALQRRRARRAPARQQHASSSNGEQGSNAEIAKLWLISGLTPRTRRSISGK